jgi:hypothetical protein
MTVLANVLINKSFGIWVSKEAVYDISLSLGTNLNDIVTRESISAARKHSPVVE